MEVWKKNSIRESLLRSTRRTEKALWCCQHTNKIIFMGAILLFGMLAFVNFRIRNNPFLIHVCACMFMAFYLGVVSLQPSEKEAFRNGRAQEIQKLNEELAASQEKLQAALVAAEKASRAKTTFLSNMSHDIRTPMNAIVGLTTLLEHEIHEPEKLQLHIQKIQNSSQHLLGLINDILDMSKIESSEVKLNEDPVDLMEQVAQIDSIICPQAEERGQEFKIHVHGIDHGHLLGDSVRLRQIFINLLSNAVKYTPVEGSVILDLTEEPSSIPEHANISITVTDTGYGMTPEFIKTIFEPFTRAENSTTNKIQGTGLGMAITKSIVDLMGGRIQVKSELNKGSCFEVVLPFAIDPNGSQEKNGKYLHQEGEKVSVLKGMKFLCAEDNELNAEILEAILEMYQASCKICPDGEKLVEAFETSAFGDYDAILMDVQMPNMNGLEATKRIRNGKNPLGRTIPIIAMTANAFNSDVQECLDAGMDAHVSKPLDIGKIINSFKFPINLSLKTRYEIGKNVIEEKIIDPSVEYKIQKVQDDDNV